MRIQRIRWANYRRLVDGEIEVRDQLVVVGPIDSGKSSLLRAAHLCLGVPGAQLGTSLCLRDLTSLDAPLELEVELTGIADEDRAVFPDEIEIGPPETLTIRIEASVDPDDTTSLLVQRTFPFGGHRRSLSRLQLDTIGWQYIPATRSMARELGTGAGSTARELLLALDLSADDEAFGEVDARYRAALEDSSAIRELRSLCADALSAALPSDITTEDIGISPATELLNSPLAGAAITIRDGDHQAPIAEQSDGVRALTLLALAGIANTGLHIIAIDEPETHLHPSAQRAVAEGLRDTSDQRLLATHSSAVVSRMSPLDLVAFGADRRARQLRPTAPIAAMEESVRHWSHRLIEPLTSRRIILIEGVSERILCGGIARLQGYNLDRIGITLFELDGAEFFPVAHRLFGPPGFDLPLFGMVDSDAAAKWAEELGVDRTVLEATNIFECVPDLEGAYVQALGVERMVELLTADGCFNEQNIYRTCGVASVSDLTPGLVSDFCRHKRRKVRAAMAVSAGLEEVEAASIEPIARLLKVACT